MSHEYGKYGHGHPVYSYMLYYASGSALVTYKNGLFAIGPIFPMHIWEMQPSMFFIKLLFLYNILTVG